MRYSCRMKSNMASNKQSVQGNSHEATPFRNNQLKRKKREKKLSRSTDRIRADIFEIREGQKRIREGQKEVREKLEDIRKEAAKLNKETNLISKQSTANQLKLDLMFQIVKARAENDSAMDARLTQALRDLMAKQDSSESKLSNGSEEE